MNFFEYQDRARRNTTRLVFLFSLAVAGIVVALYAASRVVLRYALATSTGPATYPWWDPGAFAIVAAGSILFIGLASLIKAGTLAKGGGAVAEMLGGRPVSPETTDPAKRRFVNVVEEMALASGVPVPKTYVLDKEEGINAFAAGHTPNDAAVAVTAGTLRRLNRAELQGVVGHEFSHILNGDMRLNVRLIGILFGILAIGILGRIFIRVGASSGRGSRRGGGAAAIPIAGLLLILIGFIGTFVGRLIQAAVCREREYLADSSAVQFTREPMGLAGALKKIGALANGSLLRTPKAEQASHLFFSPGVKIGLFSAALATHPPLAERIRRIEPEFDGTFPALEEGGGAEGAASTFAGPPVFPAAGHAALDPAAVVVRVGNPSEEDIAAAAGLRDLLPYEIRTALATPAGAASVLTALFLDRDDGIRSQQLAGLAEGLPADTVASITAAWEKLRDLDASVRLPIADLAAPTLATIEPAERAPFLARIEALVRADRKVTLFEFALETTIARRFRRIESPVDRIRYRSFGPLLRDVAGLLGAIARAGSGGDEALARGAFERGAARLSLGTRTTLPFRPDEPTDYGAVGTALDRLAESSFSIREQVVDACAHAALADRVVSLEEAELLRVVSSSVDCPLPPFLRSGRASGVRPR